MKVQVAVIAVVSWAMVGCGGSSYPEPKTTRSEVAIGAAQALGAEHVPGAELHLGLAKEQLAVAQRLIDDDEDDRAYLVLGRAEADARLAQALARGAALQKDAARAAQRVRELAP